MATTSELALLPFEPVIDLKLLEAPVVEKARTVAARLNIEDSQSVIQYGVSAQSKVSAFADTMLNQVRAKDSGYAGEILSNLVLKVKEVDVGSIGSGGFLSRIPIIGGLINSIRRFIARYERMSVQIEQLVDELEKARMGLLRDVTMLDGLFGKNRDYLEELDILIAAGQIKSDELRATRLPELQEKAKTSGDPLDAQKFQDFLQSLTRFEKKLHDLKLSRVIGIQMGPQIRLIQNNDQTLVEKIQSSILTTIPLWKNQIVIAISLFRQKKALTLQREVTNTTNELLAKNSEMLKQGTIEVAKESERGIVDIETLRKVNDDLIATIEETLGIQETGRKKRAEAEQELSKMESELKAKLVESRGA